MDRGAADRIVKRLARRAGISKADLAKQPSPHVHHLGVGRRRRAERRAGLCRRPPRTVLCGPADDDAIRPWPPVVGPARHVPRRRVRRWRIPHPLNTRRCWAISRGRIARHRRKCSGRARSEGRDYRRGRRAPSSRRVSDAGARTLTVFADPRELAAMSATNWRWRCRVAVCSLESLAVGGPGCESRGEVLSNGHCGTRCCPGGDCGGAR